MTSLLGSGIVLGLAAGLAPGPLLTLVVSETLRHGSGAGIRVALAPLITDLPIILASLYLLSRLSDFHGLLGLISLCGAAYVSLLAWQNLRIQALQLAPTSAVSRSLLKGILANLLNPHPYLFWFSVGAPIILEAVPGHASIGDARGPLLFLGAFYLCLVGSKILLALIMGRARNRLVGRSYVYSMRLLGGLLGLLAMSLFIDGLRLMGIHL